MEIPEERFTLKQITNSIKSTIEQRYARTYWVTAEMHKLNRTKKGHCYPELVQKEKDTIIAEMRGTVWKTQFDRIEKRFIEVVKEPLRDGLELLFLVKIVYHPIYNLGLEIIDIDPNYALGALHRERQETLERLHQEGILNKNQFLEMALLPKRLAIISQADSKGYSDFILLLNGHAKNYHYNTFLFDATLQGDAAIGSIQKQLSRIASVHHHFDAVVIIRGGGGEIGMHCYNNYELAKAIALFPLPVLTGIGHSTNMTVCEMIAFRNGITPSDMAYFLLSIFEELDAPLNDIQLILPEKTIAFLMQKKNQIDQSANSVQQSTRTIIRSKTAELYTELRDFEHAIKQLLNHKNERMLEVRKHLRSSVFTQTVDLNNRINTSKQIIELNVRNKINQNSGILSEIQRKMIVSVPRFIDQIKDKTAFFERSIQLVDPMRVLQRGYSIVTNKKGVLTENNKPQKGETIQVKASFGDYEAEINT